MYDDQKDKLEQQKAIKMMNQMKVIEGSTVPIGNNDVCGIPDLPLVTQDDIENDNSDEVQVEDSIDSAGISYQQADKAGPCNQPAILNNVAENPEEASVEIVYDDTTADFSQESSFNQSTSRQLTGNVES